MTTGIYIALTMAVTAALFALTMILLKRRYRRLNAIPASREAGTCLAQQTEDQPSIPQTPHTESISIAKKVLLDEGEEKFVPVSILPAMALDELEIWYSNGSICSTEIVDGGLKLTGLTQGKVILTVKSGEVSERCLVCVRKLLTLDIMLKTDKSGDKVGEMTAFLSSDEEIKYRCQVLFNVTVDGKNRYFFANKGASESSFISNRHEDIPHVGEELAKLRKQEDRIQSLRLWVTNLKYDEDRYHIVIKNRFKAHHYWWKKYDK